MKRTGWIFLCLLALLFSVCGALSSCKKRETEQPTPPDTEQRPDNPGGAGDDTDEGWPETIFEPGMADTGKVGMTAEYLGTVARRLPEVSDGGLGKYPVYGETLSATAEEKAAILAENNALVASADTYDGMDEDGNLYLAGEPVGRKLYKHTAAAGMYEGDVSDDEPALVNVDARLMVQLVVNLVNNAITYTPAGSHIVISIGVDDGRVACSVADDGPGIAPEDRERIFESFYTANHGLADSHRSVGLGLSLCRSIALAHGGSIEVAAADPHGSVFTIELPVADVSFDKE